jgi:4-carboxymuconolactone decarboxylase
MLFQGTTMPGVASKEKGKIMTQQEREQQGLRKLQEIAGEWAGSPLSDWDQIAPDMRRYIVEFVAGDILSRPGLDPKSRQLATVAMLAAMSQAPDEFRMHLAGAMRLGWTREELVEVLLQTAVFAGFPASLNALKWAEAVFAQRG